MQKEFIKFSPTQFLKNEALKLNSNYSLTHDMCNIMRDYLGASVGCYGADTNSMDTGTFVFGYYSI